MKATRTMLITGSRRGIGRYLAEHYLSGGFFVWGCSRQPSDLVHPHYRHTCLDVSSEPEVLSLFAQLRSEAGGLEVLVNNAGIASMNHALLTPLSTAERILRTNVTGTFLFIREAAKLMQSAGRGRIVNFATVAVPWRLEGEALYAASKAAVISLTEVLARELGPFNITVNAVGPSVIRTDLTRSVPAEKLDRLLARQALRREGTAADVANVVDFFIRPESDFITGQTIYLGGL